VAKLRVLVVEDDLASANALSLLLKNRGYEVIHSTTLADAMRWIDGSLYAIVLDLMLPDGNGSGVLEQIRHRQLPTKVLVTTGVNDMDQIARLKNLAPTRLLKKPINLADLLRGLSE
jgi:DNA-binding response OmpR family regulator